MVALLFLRRGIFGDFAGASLNHSQNLPHTTWEKNTRCFLFWDHTKFGDVFLPVEIPTRGRLQDGSAYSGSYHIWSCFSFGGNPKVMLANIGISTGVSFSFGGT